MGIKGKFHVGDSEELVKLRKKCCGNCAGSPWCSPGSGKCYPTQEKSYYESCPVDPTPAPPPTPSPPPTPAPVPECCGNCAGSPWCSPGSGNCYAAQNKPYYESCPVDPQPAPSPTPRPPPGTPSPLEPGCYFKQSTGSEKCDMPEPVLSWARDTWGEENENSGASESDCMARKSGHDEYCEVTTEWLYVPQCCGDCHGNPWCSPHSGRCYPTQAKSHYQSCPLTQ